MPNTSATGGFLSPVGLTPAYGQDLAVFCQSIVCGITSIDGTLARPRWQPEPPNLPPFGTDWVALGVTTIAADVFPYVKHDPDTDGQDELIRHETLELFCSFYGPNSQKNAALLRDGLAIPQNREVLLLNDMGLVDVGNLTQVPELFNERWRGRTDVTVTLRRQVKLTYAVLNLLSAQGDLITEVGLDLKIDTP